MFSARALRLIAGKVGYTVSCFLAAVLLVVAGYAHKAVADLSALGGGITIGGSLRVGQRGQDRDRFRRHRQGPRVAARAARGGAARHRAAPSSRPPHPDVNLVPVAVRLRLGASAAADNGAAGGAITVAANARFGIPCVY